MSYYRIFLFYVKLVESDPLKTYGYRPNEVAQLAVGRVKYANENHRQHIVFVTRIFAGAALVWISWSVPTLVDAKDNGSVTSQQ